MSIRTTPTQYIKQFTPVLNGWPDTVHLDDLNHVLN